MIDELHVHVGAHKAGSTLLQAALEDDRRELSAAGTTVVLRRDLDEIAPGLHPSWRRGDVEIDALEGLWTKLGRKLSGRVVISYEEILGAMRSFHPTGRLYPDATPVLEGLVDALRPLELKVHLFTRRQDTFIEAVYSQSIYVGRSWAWEDWVSQLESLELSWSDLIERIEAAAGRPCVRYFEEEVADPVSFVSRFYDEIRSGIRPSMRFDYENQNRGLSGVALAVLLAANSRVGRRDQVRLRRFVRKTLPQPRYAKPRLFEPSQSRLVLEALAADNRRLHSDLVSSDLAESPYLPSAVEFA